MVDKKNQQKLTMLCICLLLVYSSFITVAAEGSNHTDKELVDTSGLPKMQITDLGMQMDSVSLNRSVVTEDKDGNHIMYAVMTGNPARLLIIDLLSNTLIKEIPIVATFEGKEHVGEVMRGLTVAPDGSIYIAGSYTDHLFKYVEGSDHVTSLGPVIPDEPGQRTMDMDSSSDGLIFGGTYNQGRAYIYDTNTNEFTDLGRMLPPEQYVYSLVYDEEEHDLYLGMGSNAHIIKYDLDTNEKSEVILPEEYQDYNFIFELDIEGGKIFAKLSPSSSTLVLDKETGEFEYIIPGVLSRGVSPKSPVDDKVYYTRSNILHTYDIASKAHESLGINIGGETRESDFVQLDDPEFPGYTLVGVTQEGRLFKYNLDTKTVKVSPLAIEGEPAQMQSIGAGHDGRIHTGAYLGVGTAMYDPETGETTQYTDKGVGIGEPIYQAEAIIPYGDKIIYGGYGDSTIYVLDPDLPWNRTGSGEKNPIKLFDLKAEGQDRPFAMLGLESYNQLIFGTVPGYGELGGALNIYDFETEEVTVNRNLIPNQSIVSLTYKDGFVYGGTSIWGGLGIDPVETEAKFFIWDIEKEEKVFESIPVPDKKGITSLTVGPDGNIWGLAEGTLFIFDTDTREIVYSETKFGRTFTNTVWRDSLLELGKDGNIYGTIANQVFMIDADSKKTHIIQEGSGVHRITQDPFGNFYFIDKHSLWKIELIETELVQVELSSKEVNLVVGNSTELDLIGKLEDGEHANLDEASIEYILSDSDIASVEDGILTSHQLGSVELFALVTLDGKTIQSNTITIEVTTNLEVIYQLIEDYQSAGNIQISLATKLKNKLDQAEHHMKKNREKQAIKHMDDFLKHLNDREMEKFIDEEAKEHLETHGSKLRQQWIDES